MAAYIRMGMWYYSYLGRSIWVVTDMEFLWGG